jgi:hypothetical protein
MVFSIKKFRHYLICNSVVFFVDHMAIKYLVNKAKLNGRLAKLVLLLEEFDYTVEYKPTICLDYQKSWVRARWTIG